MASLEPYRSVEPPEGSSHSREVWLAREARQRPGLLLQGRGRLRRPGQSYWPLKRGIDLAVAIPLAIATLPITAVAATAIYVGDRGPILFSQPRTGKGGKRFRIYKFRTMVPDAEARKAELRAHSEVAWPDFKMSRDPRITSVGRILRATYIDELPQLINVIKGEMTLVGPRPTSFDAGVYRPWQTARLDVTPGITGLWQLDRAKAESTLDGRTRMDIRYVQQRSLRRDFLLLGRTVLKFAKRDGM